MRLSPCLFACLSLLAAGAPAARAEPVSDSGYAIGCTTEEGPPLCTIAASGFLFSVSEDGVADAGLFAQLLAMTDITAVTFAGEMSDIGDSSASLFLSSLGLLPDDPYQASLRMMQGRWSPEAEDTPFEIHIRGLDWVELQMDEVLDSFLMTVGASCNNPGTADALAVTLYRYGDDPDPDGCWSVDQVDDTRMVLRDGTGQQGIVTLLRVPG